MPCVPVRVAFEIDTADMLGQIQLELNKTCHPNDEADWTVGFTLLERDGPAKSFRAVYDVSLTLQPEDYAGAETIADEGLCAKQRGQALLAADTIKTAQAGLADPLDIHQQIRQMFHVE